MSPSNGILDDMVHSSPFGTSLQFGAAGDEMTVTLSSSVNVYTTVQYSTVLYGTM